MKTTLTCLLLTGTLLSCAAAKQDVIKTEPTFSPTIEEAGEKLAPSSSFGQETPVIDPSIQDLPPADQESIPITVVPPPEGTDLEVIPNSAPEKAEEQTRQPETTEVAAANYPYMVMRPTGRTNNFRNPIYEVVMFANGKAVGKVEAVTGRAHTQSRNRNTAGNESPLPNGMYRVSSSSIGGTHPEVGGRFLPITPMFSTNRSALGFHVDPSFNRSKKEDGTAGCIGITTVAARDTLFRYAQQYKPRYLKVDI